MIIKGFKEFLTEMAYQDLKDIKFKDKFDKAFGEYALNEKPIHWDEKERNDCKKSYGNVDVGIVYHGNRIISKEQLTFLESLKKGMKYSCNLISATPDKSLAKSFMEYVKSYDESITYRSLLHSMTMGSAGKFGSFLLTLKPTPSQVIASTFGETKKKFTRTAENECILFGDVEIKDIKIVEPLTYDNWFEKLKNDFLDLYSSSFFHQWLEHHKLIITKEQSVELINTLKTENDIKSFFKITKEYPEVFNKLSLSDIEKNKLLYSTIIKYLKFKLNNPIISFDDEDIHLRNEEFNTFLIKKNKKAIDDTIKNKLEELKEINHEIFFNEKNGVLTFQNTVKDWFYVLENAKERKIKIPFNPFNEQIKRIVEKLKNMSETYILSSTLQKSSKSDLDIIQNLFQSYSTLFNFINIFPSMNLSFMKKSWNWFYHSFASGSIEDKKMLDEYTYILRRILSNQHLLTALTNIR